MKPRLLVLGVALATLAAAVPVQAGLYAVRFSEERPLTEAERLGATVRLIGAGEAIVEGEDRLADLGRERGLLIRPIDDATDGETAVVWYPGAAHRTPSVGRVLWSDRLGTHLVAASPADIVRLRSEAHQVIELPDAIDAEAWFDPTPPSHLLERRGRDERAWRGAVEDAIDAVSSDSLMAYVERLSQTSAGQSRTRFVFHDECLDVAKPEIVSALTAFLPSGSPIEFQPFGILGYTCEGGVGGPTLDYPAENIIATLEGNGRLGGAYIVCAHYDATASNSAHDDSFAFWWCQNDAPGADDNATGVATVLETARVLAGSGLEFPFDIRFILFTAEELGLVGSDVYADSVAAAGDTIYGVINVDMIAYKPNAADPDTCHLVTNDSSVWLADWLLDTVDEYDGSFPSFESVRIDSPLLYSDHGSFWIKGYDGLVAIEHWNPRDRNPYYHTVNDRFSTVHASQLASTTRLVAGGMARLADPDGAFNLAVFEEDIAADPREPWTGSTVDIRLDVHAFGPDTTASFTVELWDGGVDDGELLTSREVDRVVGTGEVVTVIYPWPLDDGDVGDHELTARIVVDDGPQELTLSDNEATTVLTVRAEGAVRVLEHHPVRNPARSVEEAAITYELSREVQLVEIEVYDVTGQKVLSHTMAGGNQGLSAGWNEVRLADMSGDELASGVYIYRLRVVARDRGSTSDVVTGKLALVR
jgi:hypothetical protein